LVLTKSRFLIWQIKQKAEREREQKKEKGISRHFGFFIFFHHVQEIVSFVVMKIHYLFIWAKEWNDNNVKFP
jgi:hypothetical protein